MLQQKLCPLKALRQLLDVYKRQGFITLQSDATGFSVFIKFPHHINQSGFPRCAVPTDNGEISLKYKIILYTLISYYNSVLSFHLFSSQTYKPAIGTSSFML